MDGTENPKGLSSEGQTSEGETQGTSKQTRTYTEEELQKAKSDALAQAGRDAKALSDREAAIKAREEAAAESDRRREEAELTEARKDPDKLAQYNKKQADKQIEKQRKADSDAEKLALRKEREQLEREKAENEAVLKAWREDILERKVFELAGKYNLNPVVLKDGMKDLGLSTAEQAEALAKRLSEKQPKEPLEVDSGVTSGHKGSMEGKSARQLYAEDFREKQKK